jgi:hypothetical protein
VLRILKRNAKANKEEQGGLFVPGSISYVSMEQALVWYDKRLRHLEMMNPTQKAW